MSAHLPINGSPGVSSLYNDDIPVYFGTSQDATLVWDTKDANANMFKLGLPAGDATNVPAFLVGVGSAIINTDLGFLDGKTEPFIGVTDAAGSRYGGIQWGSTFMDFVTDSGTTQFRFPGPLNLASSVLFGFEQSITFGTGNEGSSLRQSSTQGSSAQGATLWGLGSDNYAFILTGKSVIGSNHDHPAYTNPTHVVQSATNPDVSNNEFGLISHNQSNFVLSSGANVGTGTGATTINNGILINPASLTSGAAGNYALKVARTLNDTGAAGGSDTFAILELDATPTDVTGWDDLYIADFKWNGTSKFGIDSNGSVIYTGRKIGSQGADVASANNLTLGTDGNAFEITGTTQVNLIDNTGWENGSMITLLFTSTPTVKHNQATSGSNITIQLAGAADFAATAGDTLTLMLSEIGGTQAWREVARAAI